MTSLLDLDLMRTLLHLAEEGSFTKAGERLGLTQQAISAQVKRMERAIGRPVVIRSGTRVRLTTDGEALVEYAKLALDVSDRVRRHFTATRLSGSLRLGILEGFATIGLPLFLASLREVHPDLELAVETSSTERLLLRQENGKLDIVLGAQRQGDCRGERLWPDRLRWFGDDGSYEDPGTPVRLALPPEPSLLRASAIEALTKAGRPYIVAFQGESRASLRAAALCGIGVTVSCSFDEIPNALEETETLPRLAPIEYFLRADTSRGGLVAEAARLLRTAAQTVFKTDAATPLPLL